MASGTEPFYLDPSFWVFGSTTVFVVGIAVKGGFKKIGELLDAKSKEIAANLEEARQLRDEAEALLQEYQKRQRESEKDAAKILEQAKEDARIMVDAADREIKELSERRRRLADEKIKQAEAAAVKEVRAAAVDVAVEATRRLLADQMTGKAGGKMVDDAIKDVSGRLH